MSKLKLILFLILATCIAYFSSLANPFIWDDEQFITSNVYVQQFDVGKIFTTNTIAGAGDVSNYYRPLTSLSFAIDAKIWRQNSFGFHLTNISLHISSGVLLFLLLDAIGIGQLGSFFISLIFLIFPSQVEAVTFINSRGDSLYTAFLFLSLFLFFKAFRQNKLSLFFWSFICYMMSIFSKETAISAFPLFFAITIFDRFTQRGKIFKMTKAFKRTIVFTCLSFAGVAVYMLLRLTVLNFSNTLNYYSEQTVYSSHLDIRLLTFARILWTYMGILLWPQSLHMERSIRLVTSIFSWEVWGILLLFVAIVAFGIWEIRKKKSAFMLFGFFWAVVMLVPVSGIIPINGMLFEHWLYVPMVGFFIMLFAIFRVIFFRIPKRILISFSIVISILYIFLTIHQNNIWSDPITFYRYTLFFAPESARLHNNLAMSYADVGKNQEALAEYTEALALGQNYPEIYNNIGNIYRAMGKYDLAEQYLLDAIKLSPHFAIAKENLIKVYLLSNQYDKALKLSGTSSQIKQLIQELQSQ